MGKNYLPRYDPRVTFNVMFRYRHHHHHCLSIWSCFLSSQPFFYLSIFPVATLLHYPFDFARVYLQHAFQATLGEGNGKGQHEDQTDVIFEKITSV